MTSPVDTVIAWRETLAAMRPSGEPCPRILIAVAVLTLVIINSSAAHAAEWRYCYAFEEAGQRFVMSTAFRPAEPMDRVERAWRDFLAKEGVSAPRTGCPRGLSREDIADAMKGATAYNRADGHHVIGLDWPAGDPVAGR